MPKSYASGSGENDSQLLDPLTVRGMANDTHEPPQREVDQAVRGSVRGELVVADVEARAVDQVLAEVRREQDPAPQAGEIRLLRPVSPGEAAPSQQHDARQKQMDERLEHVETLDRADARTVKLGLPETAPVPQHRQEDPPGVFVPAGHEIRTAVRLLAEVSDRTVPVVREIDLRKDLDHGSAARFDDANVVLCVEATVPECENGPPLNLFFGRLRERESLQITLFVLTQSGQRLVLANHQHARGRHGQAPGVAFPSSADAFDS